MIPKHICTPYCDGQRYCVEPGTHTLNAIWLSTATQEEWRNYFRGLDMEFIRAKINPDRNRKPAAMRIFGTDEPTTLFMPEKESSWLVTVRERECHDSRAVGSDV